MPRIIGLYSNFKFDCSESSALKFAWYIPIIVVIMIKSSVPHFANTYRILRVLSNQDYLATDHKEVKYIFSQAKNFLEQPNSHPNNHKYLLVHRQIITIDDIQYAVFEVGNHEVVWAPFANSKKIDQEGFIQYIIKHACQNILKELIWMGSSQAKKYLDLKNFWLIDNKLYLLLLPRQNQVKFTIKKCQKRSLSNDKSIDLIIQAQKTLMKQFTLLLWQICFQCSLYEDKCITSHYHSKQLLIRMVNKSITFEQLLNELSKQFIGEVYNNKVKFKTIDCRKSPPRRKIFTSFEKINKSAIQTIQKLNASRSIKGNTQSLKRPYETNQKLVTQTHETKLMRNKSIFSVEKRSMSVQDTTNYKKDNQRKTRYLQQHFTHNASKETIQYERWLHNKKYSIQIREKLYKNGEIARKKFSQAFQNTSKEQKFDDSAFKQKILSKVIKFKNAITLKKSSIQNNTEETIICQPQNQHRTVQNLQLNQLNQKEDVEIKDQINQHSRNFVIPQRQRVVYKQDEQTVRHETPALSNAESEQGRKVENDYIYTNHRLSFQEEKIHLNSLKTEKKKLNRIDIVTNNSSIEEDLQQVKLTDTKPVQHPPRPTIKLPIPISRQTKTTNKYEFKLMASSQAVNELVMLINTLGDITIRTAKNKDKLNDINWRIPTYFMYERFHLQREKIAQSLKNNLIICRKHRRVDQNQWKQYVKSKGKEDNLIKISKENEQIITTLNRLGQKVLEEQTPQRKIEYFIKNRQMIPAKSQSKLRTQLSKFLISSIVSQFDFALEEGFKSKDILNFLIDSYFGMYVIAELDGMIPQKKFIRLDQYKEYDRTLADLKPCFDYIDQAYFPKEEAWQTL